VIRIDPADINKAKLERELTPKLGRTHRRK